jgi:uracil-DNA glycosylase family 4
MIVGEMPDTDDWFHGTVLHSKSNPGRELDNMLRELGLQRHECSITTVVKERAPSWKLESLYTDSKCMKFGPEIQRGLTVLAQEIQLASPTVIIALGNLALQALTGMSGIMKWRGSVMQSLPEFGSVKVVPTYAPATVLKMWEWRPIAMRDLKRAYDESSHPDIRRPAWQFTIRPSFESVMSILGALQAKVEQGPYKLSVDIETRAGFIACVGIAWSPLDALCIPLMAVGNPEGYWTFEQEEAIYDALRYLLQHPNARIIGQNFAYDVQYFAVEMGIFPRIAYDTMLQQHVFLLGMKKSLDFISSMYCEYYYYWKDDGKEWNPKIPEETYWSYNCEDCVRTYECSEVLASALQHAGLETQYDFLRDMWPIVVRTMLKGVRIDEKRKAEIGMQLWQFIEETNGEIAAILGHPINIASPKQMMALFYTDFQMKEVRNKKTKRPTSDDDALTLFKKREPILTGLVERIQMVRSANVLRSTFANMPLDLDKRMRCFYNIAGTETLRLSSRENAFGSGGNLQNIPPGDDDKVATKKLAEINKGHRQLIVPPMRKMFIPDPGYTFFDIDLDRADLMVVIWEADDDGLRQAIQDGVDLHTYNASALFGIPESRIVYAQRQAAKMFAHGTNYGGSARTMAINCGFTVHQSEIMQRRWFAEHPGIKEWHRRTEAQLQATRQVTNAFGYRRRYFDRIESILPEALAWQPQSIVALVINKAWKNIAERVPEVDILLQVHDSLAGQFPTHIGNPCMRKMRECMKVVVPYDKPLIIGAGIKTSELSWGDCEDRDWPEPLLIAPQTSVTI